jgi:hypothetical protein
VVGFNALFYLSLQRLMRACERLWITGYLVNIQIEYLLNISMKSLLLCQSLYWEGLL